MAVTQRYFEQCYMGCAGFGLAGLGWAGLSWAELGWAGLSWAELVWSRLVWSGLVWLVLSGLVWSGLGQAGGLGCFKYPKIRYWCSGKASLEILSAPSKVCQYGMNLNHSAIVPEVACGISHFPEFFIPKIFRLDTLHGETKRSKNTLGPFLQNFIRSVTYEWAQ